MEVAALRRETNDGKCAGVPVSGLELADSIEGHLKPLLRVTDVPGNGERGEGSPMRGRSRTAAVSE